MRFRNNRALFLLLSSVVGVWFLSGFNRPALAAEVIDLTRPETWEATISKSDRDKSAIFDRLATFALGKSEYGNGKPEPLNDQLEVGNYEAGNYIAREKAYEALLAIDRTKAFRFYLQNLDNDDAILELGEYNGETYVREQPCARLLSTHFWTAFPEIVHYLATTSLSDKQMLGFRAVVWWETRSDREAMGLQLPFRTQEDYENVRVSIMEHLGQQYPEGAIYRKNLATILQDLYDFRGMGPPPPREGAGSPPTNDQGAKPALPEHSPKEISHTVPDRPRGQGPLIDGPMLRPDADGGVTSPATSRESDPATSARLLATDPDGFDRWLIALIASLLGLAVGFAIRGWTRVAGA